MGIPIRSVGTLACASNIVGPIFEFVKGEINNIKNIVSNGDNNTPQRNDPEHVGIGFEVKLPSTIESKDAITSDISVRIDFLNLAIDVNNTIEPKHITPTVHLATELKSFDEYGEQNWLYGGPMESTRLRSMSNSIKWNENGWATDIVLQDAVRDGVIDWSSPSPGKMNLSSNTSDIDLGFGELVNSMLSYRDQEFSDSQSEAFLFMKTLQLLGVASPPNILDGTLPWVIDESNLHSLAENPDAYLTPLLTNGNGDWDLTKSLDSGDSFLSHLSLRLPRSKYFSDISHPRHGQLLVRIPIRSVLEGADLFIHPNGFVEFDIKQFPIGKSRLSANIGLDIAGAEPSSSTDGMTLTFDARLDLTDKPTGLFSGSYLHAVFDENLPPIDRLIVDLHLPRMGKIMAPLHDLNQSVGQSTWVSTPDSVRLHPPPTVEGQSLGDFLSTTSPTVILDMLTRLTIDAYLLSKVKGDGVLGEVMEVLELVDQQSDGRYTCDSLLDFVRAPRAYLEDMFFPNQSLDVAKLLQLSGAIMRGFDLPHYEQEDTNGSTAAIVFELGRGSSIDAVFAELAVMVHPMNSSGLAISLRSPSTSTSSSIEFDFDMRMNLTPGPVFDIDGTSLSITARPNDLIADAGGNSATFLANSFITITAELIQGTLHVSMDLSIDGATTSHLTLLPNISGFSSLLSSTLGSVVPNLLTLLLRNKLTTVTFGPNNDNLGDILIGYFHDINLWNAPNSWNASIPNAVTELRSGELDGPLFAQIATEPRQWLMGPDPSEQTPVFATAALEDVLIGGVRAISKIVLDSNIVNSVENVGADENYVQLSIGTYPGVEVIIGRKDDSNFGIWVGMSPDVIIGSRLLDIEIEAGCTFVLPSSTTTFGISPHFQLSAKMDQDFATSSSLRIKPGVSFSWSPSTAFVLEAATDQKDTTDEITWIDNGVISGNGFWLKWGSNSSPSIHCGRPDLSDLAAGAIDIILGFIEEIPAVQDWLKEPLITVNGNPINASKPGEIGEALLLLVQQPSSQYKFTEHPNLSVVEVVQTWISNPVGTIINAISGLLESEIAAGSGRLTLYEKTEGTFNFKISIVDSNAGTGGAATFGIAFEFEDPPEIEMGKLRLQLYTQDKTDLNAWVNRGPENEYTPGLTIYFAEWNSSTSTVVEHLSVEMGGIGFRLSRADGEPLLDKFFTLNTVETALALDLNIIPTAPVEFGAQLNLDDFGIELGGGDSDGGNGMAKGLLSGDEDGKDAVMPIFDISLSKYHQDSLNISLRGQSEYWFPINKQFGPVNVSEVGVIYSEDTTGKYANPHRLSILLDANAEISGFYAACDDLGVNIPILKPFDFSDWGFELKGLAIKMDKGKLKIAGALAKQEEFAYFPGLMDDQIENATDIIPSNAKAWVDGEEVDATWAIPYVEYQGLCSIITPAFGISAIGAFARVPKGDGTGFVSCFIIAALDMPLGGPPFFFINGLVGGLGLNRDLTLPSIDEVENHLLIQSLGGFSDPMDALASIKPQFPVKYGSFWFALGLKFKTVEIMETRAVLFARFGDDFTIGLLGLSTMDLPKPSIRIAHIELAILAYYDSGENVLWVQAQLTDDSYLFDETCRLTGGFALVTWFNTGEFVISLGGYHPNFNVPDYYPVVPRLGFNWKPTSTLTVKGGVYFTLCSRAVMLGGRLDASFKKGKIKASFVAGMDALVQFDPFHYEFDIYINLSIKVGRLKAGIGADLHIEGPRMHGIAQLEVLFVKFKVKFGNNDSPPSQLTVREFLHKHIRQLSSGSPMAVSSWLNSEEAHTTTVVEGIIRSKEQDESNMGSDMNPYLVGPEFSLSLLSKFPSKESNFLKSRYTQGRDPSGALKPANSVVLFPVSKKAITPITTIRLFNLDTNSELEDAIDGMDFIPTLGGFASSTWSTEGKTSTVGSKFFMNGGLMKATTTFEDGGQCIAFEGNIEPCEMKMHLPLQEDETALVSMIDDLNTITLDLSKSPMALIESIITDEKVSVNARAFKTEVEKKGSFRRDVL